MPASGRRQPSADPAADRPKDLTDLEHADIRESTIGVSLCGGDKARNKARPHVGKLSRDRVSERKLGLAAA